MKLFARVCSIHKVKKRSPYVWPRLDEVHEMSRKCHENSAILEPKVIAGLRLSRINLILICVLNHSKSILTALETTKRLLCASTWAVLAAPQKKFARRNKAKSEEQFV